MCTRVDAMGSSTERLSAVSWYEHIRRHARTRLEAHVANENNADYLDDFELDEPEGILNAASAPAETPIFERPARPRKTAEPINEMTETGSIDAVYVSDSDYSGKGLSDSSYRRSRSGMNQLRRDLHYGQYLEIPKGRRDIFRRKERWHNFGALVAVVFVLAAVAAAAYFCVMYLKSQFG